VEVASLGKFVAIEVMMGVEVQASGPDGALERRARAATEPCRGGDGQRGHGRG
jgi:hypothetical protein